MKEEFKLIENYFKKLATNKKFSLNLNDDVAKISCKNDEEIIVSKDMIVEDVHFLKSERAKIIAAKLLLSNLSDIASSGAKPFAYCLGFSKNNKMSEDFIKEFCEELKTIQTKYKLTLIGGDTVNSKNLFFSITIFGFIKKNRNLARYNAKNCDNIYVSGNIGDSFIGLSIKLGKLKLDQKYIDYFIQKHDFPEPRVKLGQFLVKNNLSKCACDISDGLLLDLSHISKSSNLIAHINLEEIPVSNYAEELLKANIVNIEDLISGGEDYELIFTAPKTKHKKIMEFSKKNKIKISKIGEMSKINEENHDKNNISYKNFIEKNQNNGIILKAKNITMEIKKFGYEHF